VRFCNFRNRWATGQLAKTNRLEARMLAQFAERVRLGSAPTVLHKELSAHIRWLEGRLK
jgi:hypothetical protein